MEYSIGEFASLMKVTVKTLHHYDKINLLKPVQIDPVTGYRRYDSEQFSTIIQIRKYRALGFTLPAIRQLLSQDAGGFKERGLLERQRHKLMQSIGQELAKVREISTLLGDVEQYLEYSMPLSTLLAQTYPDMMMLESCMQLPPPFECSARDLVMGHSQLTALSTALPSMNRKVMAQAFHDLQEQVAALDGQDAVEQLWFWTTPSDGLSEPRYQMHAGFPSSADTTLPAGTWRYALPETGACFRAPDYACSSYTTEGFDNWQELAEQAHYQLFEEAFLPAGPLMFLFNRDSKPSQPVECIQLAIFDPVLQSRHEAARSSEDRDEAVENPFKPIEFSGCIRNY